MKRNIAIVSILFVTVGCDQALKWLVRQGQFPFGTYLSGIFVVSHNENPGAFMSFGDSFAQPIRTGLFTVGVAVFLAWALWHIVRTKDMHPLTMVGWTLMIGGGVGNLIDRMVKSTVTDFLNVGIGSLRTGVFNIADMAIMAGIGILLLPERKKTQADSTING